jgi:hypothetical protein
MCIEPITMCNSLTHKNPTCVYLLPLTVFPPEPCQSSLQQSTLCICLGFNPSASHLPVLNSYEPKTYVPYREHFCWRNNLLHRKISVLKPKPKIVFKCLIEQCFCNKRQTRHFWVAQQTALTTCPHRADSVLRSLKFSARKGVLHVMCNPKVRCCVHRSPTTPVHNIRPSFCNSDFN